MSALTWVSDVSELEKFSIPQLISYLKTEFRAGVYNKVEQILTSREELWKQKENLWNRGNHMWTQKENKWKQEFEKSEKMWKQKQELWKQQLEERQKIWKGKEEMWTQRVAKLEEETSALVVLAQELSENSKVDLDVGGGILLSGWTNGGRVCDFAGIGGQIEGSPIINLPCKPLADHIEEREKSSSPGLLSGNPILENVIEISDSEDDDKCVSHPDGSDIEATDQLKKKVDIGMFENVKGKTLLSASSSLEGVKNNRSAEKYLPPSPIKRKRSLKLGSSDSEDDNIPANELSCSNSEKCTPFSTPKTRKRTLRLANSDSEDGDGCRNDPEGSSRKTIDTQKSKEGLNNVLSSIRKWKSTSLKWQFEIDMVSSFETDPILCMKAVCALYRHHIFQDKAMGGSSYSNHSGVCRTYGERGSALAKFLLGGNQDGEIKKSVKDLEAYDSKGVEDCQRLAKYYSNRLFTMYQNKEDCFFP